jgi:hypothetical protein
MRRTKVNLLVQKFSTFTFFFSFAERFGKNKAIKHHMIILPLELVLRVEYPDVLPQLSLNTERRTVAKVAHV